MRISKYLPDIVKLLSTTPILFLIAPTGTGKSLGLPAALAVLGSRVFISVPTRASVMNLYGRQVKISASFGKNFVGYAAEGDIQYNDKTKIVYVTSGHLRRKIRGTYSGEKPGPIDFCDVLILDEIHNGSLDNAINSALWEKAANEGILVPRLVLASATFPDNLNKRFSEEETGRKTFKFEAQSFPVEIQYHDKSFEPKDTEIYKQMADVIRKIISRNQKGDLLAFIPGSPEAQTLIELLSQPPLKDCDLIPAYGTLTDEEKYMIDQPTKKGRRKIIVATNMAETSITLENLDFIVDSMLEKRAETSLSEGKRLTLSRIAKDSAIQRAGRTGRLAPGSCYRMITEEDYNNLEDKRPDEIQRLPLSGVILELVSIGLDPQTLIADIDPNRLRKTLDLLFFVECIDNMDKITPKGIFAAEFPLSVRNASILYDWTLTKKPLFPALVALVLLDSYGPSSYLWVTKMKSDEGQSDYNIRVEEYRKKYFAGYIAKSDLGTFINLWNDFVESMEGYPPKQDYLVKKWCTEGSINHRQWKDMLSNLRICINTIKRLGYKVEFGPFTTKGVLDALKPFFLNTYRDLILTAKGDSYEDSNGLKFHLDNKNRSNKISPLIDEQIVALIQIELSIAGSERERDLRANRGLRIVSVAIPVKDEVEEPEIFDPVEVQIENIRDEEIEKIEKERKEGKVKKTYREKIQEEKPEIQWIPKATPAIGSFIPAPADEIEETVSSLIPVPPGSETPLDSPSVRVALPLETVKKSVTPKTKAIAKPIKKTVAPKTKVTIKAVKKTEIPREVSKEESEEEKKEEPVKKTISPIKAPIKKIKATEKPVSPIKSIERPIKSTEEVEGEIPLKKTTSPKKTITSKKETAVRTKLVIKPITKTKVSEVPPVKTTEIPSEKIEKIEKPKEEETEEVRKEGKEEEGDVTQIRPLLPSARPRPKARVVRKTPVDIKALAELLQ